MSLESAKKLGFISSLITIVVPVVMIILLFSFLFSILSSISFISGTVNPNAGLLSIGLVASIIALVAVALIGFIMFMVSMHRLSKYYAEPAIFKNVLYAFIIEVVGGIAVAGFYVAYLFVSIGSLMQTSTSSSISPVFTQFLFSYIAVIAVAFVLAVVGAVLYWRAFNKLAEKSGVDSFKTAGLLYLIGSLLTFVGIGAFIAWIAWIFAAMGYRRLTPVQAPAAYVPPYQAPVTATGATKRCPYCGTENNPDAIYCRNCGNQI